MRRTRTVQSVALATAVLAAAVLTGACGGSSSGGGGSGGTPQRGGQLTLLHYEPVATTLNRLTEVLLGSIWPISQIEENLVFVNAKGIAEPVLATSWKASADQLTWTFQMREGVKFSDGKPLTAEDAAFSIMDAKRPDAVYHYLFDSIKTAEATSPTTLTLKLKRPDPDLPLALANYTATVIPKDWGGKSEKAFNEAPIGSGPFMLDPSAKWVKGSSVTLKRNPGYWRKGRPYLDGVTFKYVSDENQRILQLKGKQANIVSFVAPDRATVALEENPTARVKNLPVYNQLYLIMSQSYAPLRDQHVRRAIVHAIDREALLKASVIGRGTAGTTFLNDKLPGYDASVGLPFDVAKAKEEMAQSGYKDGFSLTLFNSPGQEVITQVIQDALKPLNIKVNIKSIDEGARFDAELANKYEMAVQPYGMVSGSPTELFGAVIDPDVLGSMLTGFDDPKLLALARRAMAETDPAERKRLSSETQAQQAQEAYANVLFYLPQPFGFTPEVNGFRFGAGYNMGLTDTWLAK